VLLSILFVAAESKDREPVVIELPQAIYVEAPEYYHFDTSPTLCDTFHIKLSIDKKGILEDVEVVKSTNALRNYSLVFAMDNWVLRPAHKKNKPVKIDCEAIVVIERDKKKNVSVLSDIMYYNDQEHSRLLKIDLSRSKDAETYRLSKLPEPIRIINPEVPREERRKFENAVVTAKLLIGTDGSIHFIDIINSENINLTRAAAKAIAEWTYNPAEKSGEKVEVFLITPVTFK